MVVMVFGITVFLHPWTNVLVLVSMMALQLPFELKTGLSWSTTILDTLEVPPKAKFPMETTDFGMVIEVKLLHPLNAPNSKVVTFGKVALVRDLHPMKALSPMVVTEAGMVMDFRFEQS